MSRQARRSSTGGLALLFQPGLGEVVLEVVHTDVLVQARQRHLLLDVTLLVATDPLLGEESELYKDFREAWLVR